MSFFSIVKKARQAKEQSVSKPSEKQLGKQKDELAKPRYVHVPTHAAADALMGAPAGWMRDDAERIRENNIKRNAKLAGQLLRPPRPASSSIMSPLHVDVHADSSSKKYGRRLGNASSRASLRSSHTTPGTSAAFSQLSLSSLDAELVRARMSHLEASRNGPYHSQSAHTSSVSQAVSSESSTSRSSPSSSPSTSPSTYSAASFGPQKSSTNKDGNLGYYGETCGEHGPSSMESIEMRVFPSGTTKSKSTRNCNSNSSTSIMPSQYDLPSTGIQERRRQLNPYGQHVRIGEPSIPHIQHPVGHSRLSTERTLVPTTIGSPRPSPAHTFIDSCSTLSLVMAETAASKNPLSKSDNREAQLASAAEERVYSTTTCQLEEPLTACLQPVSI
ncbi:uncharacterized protein SPSK_03391 [Sporothrix schenckii 1099-18]|uniref:Uncharacterized protein n=1 Tax=Sporothrix schenckii 1099-18 TaxID=1397361 RepID=A0A0F2M150_SPOSC|nr:uncharacterized protein SPSK_03391 [Sporothrix schenckii 1099-18]KJR82465.1 hypothetical protein SPSK_03391 [Sporothrix schenckii 1099-18]